MRRKCSTRSVSAGCVGVPEERLVVAVVREPLRDRLAAAPSRRAPSARCPRAPSPGRRARRGRAARRARWRSRRALPADEVGEHHARRSPGTHRRAIARRRRRMRRPARGSAASASGGRPQHGLVPLVPLRVARSPRSTSWYLRVENDMPSGFALRTQPCDERVRLRVEELDPRPLALERCSRSSADEPQPLRAVRQVAHARGRAGRTRGRRSWRCSARRRCAPSRSTEQEEEVLGIGIVGDPAPHEELVRAAADLVLELVVGRRGDLDVEAEPPPGVDEELVAQAAARARVAACRRSDAAAGRSSGRRRPG